MRSPLDSGAWIELDDTRSTQDDAAQLLAQGVSPGVVFAHNQSQGRGRFGREWVSARGDSLTMSLVFQDYEDAKEPWLVGMAVGLAVAKAVGASVQWPNDVVAGDKKLGGVLTELFPGASGRKVPVVGVGINLNQTSFPDEIADRAVSLAMVTGRRHEATTVALQIIKQIEGLPEPTSWGALQNEWSAHDATPGKRFRLVTGEQAVAVGVSDSGSLECLVNGQPRTVMAAEAVFGQ